MASIGVFCVPEDLDRWIVSVCRHFRLWAIIQFRDDRPPTLRGWEKDEPIVDEATFACHFGRMLSPDLANRRRIRDDSLNPVGWGWATARSGLLLRRKRPRVLVMSDIVGSKSGPDDSARFVQWIRKTFATDFCRGVQAQYTGEKQCYPMKGLTHTQRAKELLQKGVRWRATADSNLEYSVSP